MKYCMECGTRLEEKYLENEGMIPFCPKCGEYRFPVFSTAVSMVVMNEKKDKILLIKQYGRDAYILVAGYVNKGEGAEHAVIREMKEETGLDVKILEFVKSEYFAPSNTLMLNFRCIVNSESLNGLTKEVDYAKWFSIEDARKNVKKESLAQRFLEECLEKYKLV